MKQGRQEKKLLALIAEEREHQHKDPTVPVGPGHGRMQYILSLPETKWAPQIRMIAAEL